jgi:hypothetical protein
MVSSKGGWDGGDSTFIVDKWRNRIVNYCMTEKPIE